MAHSYFDFELEIDHTDGGYRVNVKGAQAEEHRLIIPNSQFSFDLDGFLANIGRPARGLLRDARRAGVTPSDPRETLEAFGTKLWRTFFAEEVGQLFRRSLQHTVVEDAGLRIRMRLTDVPELAQLPWEYLYDPVEDDFVTLSSDVVLVRQPRVPQPIQPHAVNPPLRILVIIASPQDLLQLDVEREWRGLQEALSGLEQGGLVEVHLLDRATKKRLQEELEAKDYHIIHFVGHGEVDPEGGAAAFYMETEERQADPLSTRDLRTLLRGERRTLRLVVLNACKGARSAAGDPFAGLAQGLIRAGIPAVIAMQFAITDETAIHFAQEFYQRMAKGYAIDRALGEVRKSIFLNASKLEWGTPVLFMRSPDGQIFQMEVEEAKKEEGKGKEAAGGVQISIGGTISGSQIQIGDIAGGDIVKGNR